MKEGDLESQLPPSAKSIPALRVLVCTLLSCAVANATETERNGGTTVNRIVENGPVDVAPYGMPMTWDEGRARGIRWEKPRKVRRFEVEFEEGSAPDQPGSIRLEYWHRHWNGKADPVMAETGAGGYGWIAQDDWFNGEWRTASAVPTVEANKWIFTFCPTGEKEFPNLGEPGVTYRKTLQMRIASDAILPPVKEIRAYTDSIWRPVRVRIEWTAKDGEKVDWSGRLEIHNGEVTRVEPIPGGKTRIEDDGSWESMITEGNDGIIADLWMAVNPVDPRGR